MASELHIEYVDVRHQLKPITLRYKLNNLPITHKWADRLQTALDQQLHIDDPGRFYGYNSIDIETQDAVNAINTCCDIIDQYKSGFVQRRVKKEHIDQDTLNYLHNIFEQYHGTLNTPHAFFSLAPNNVKKALAQLNVEVHRCERLVKGTGRKMLPTHTVTYYDLEKSTNHVLELGDYDHFTEFYEFGTVYLLYTEIGKTLQDLAIDQDTHVHRDAYKPFRYYSADFVVRMYGMSHLTWIQLQKKYKKHYDENKEYYLSKGYNYSHPYNKPGNIPLAKLINTPIDVVTEVSKRPWVKSIKLV